MEKFLPNVILSKDELVQSMETKQGQEDYPVRPRQWKRNAKANYMYTFAFILSMTKASYMYTFCIYN